ncbi:hypothetical protein WBJ53_17040 [Spirosoma sp. SC4-14]|uniref:hypothetical protein n=1 Tax=Spirosoma sp. SC4-14 TaxID=3128900 RepID=UPI0030CFB0F4
MSIPANYGYEKLVKAIALLKPKGLAKNSVAGESPSINTHFAPDITYAYIEICCLLKN